METSEPKITKGKYQNAYCCLHCDYWTIPSQPMLFLLTEYILCPDCGCSAKLTVGRRIIEHKSFFRKKIIDFEIKPEKFAIPSKLYQEFDNVVASKVFKGMVRQMEKIEMKIIDIQKIESFSVITDEEEYFEYSRYSADCWMVRMGESDEPVYDYEELEKLFQEEK